MSEEFLTQNLETYMVQDVAGYLDETPYAGKFLSEYFEITIEDMEENSPGWIMNNLTAEIEHAQSENLSEMDMIDLWIQQDSTFAVIMDI